MVSEGAITNSYLNYSEGGRPVNVASRYSCEMD